MRLGRRQRTKGRTLQPIALVHEAWLRLAGDGTSEFENRAHFFGAAAEAMRRILIERARLRMAGKRGAGAESIPLDAVEVASPFGDERQSHLSRAHEIAANCYYKLPRLLP